MSTSSTSPRDPQLEPVEIHPLSEGKEKDASQTGALNAHTVTVSKQEPPKTPERVPAPDTKLHVKAAVIDEGGDSFLFSLAAKIGNFIMEKLGFSNPPGDTRKGTLKANPDVQAPPKVGTINFLTYEQAAKEVQQNPTFGPLLAVSYGTFLTDTQSNRAFFAELASKSYTDEEKGNIRAFLKEFLLCASPAKQQEVAAQIETLIARVDTDKNELAQALVDGRKVSEPHVFTAERNLEQELSGLSLGFLSDEEQDELADHFAHDLDNLTQTTIAQVKPHELHNLAWTKDGKEENSPNALKMSTEVNNLSNFISKKILESRDPEKIRIMAEFFMRVLDRCEERGNYQAVGIVSAGLNRTSVRNVLYSPSNKRFLVTPQFIEKADRYANSALPENMKAILKQAASENRKIIPWMEKFKLISSLCMMALVERQKKSMKGTSTVQPGFIESLCLSKLLQTPLATCISICMRLAITRRQRLEASKRASMRALLILCMPLSK